VITGGTFLPPDQKGSHMSFNDLPNGNVTPAKDKTGDAIKTAPTVAAPIAQDANLPIHDVATPPKTASADAPVVSKS
jgi:hypothetical protein